MVYMLDWVEFAIRWLHVIAAIAWIGSSFYFIFKDNSLEPVTEGPEKDKLAGDIWMVHGGGFYYAKKYTVAPDNLPDHLHWFKWEAYTTWISGFALLVVLYYFNASAYMLPPDTSLAPWMGVAISVVMIIGSWLIYNALCKSKIGENTKLLAICGIILVAILSYISAQIFSGRGAFMQMGAILGSVMAANVLDIIIPNQRKAVAAMRAGETPDPILGKTAKQRSFHNNYITLPVLFLMISNHYPMTFSGEWNWVMLLAIAGLGAFIRHFFNLKHKKIFAWWIWPTAAATGIALMLISAPEGTFSAREEGVELEEDEVPVAPFLLAETIVKLRCASCHAAEPTDPGFDEAPGGVMFDTPAQIQTHAQAILAQSVNSDIMPLGNITNMTEEERTLLGLWVREGARIDR